MQIVHKGSQGQALEEEGKYKIIQVGERHQESLKEQKHGCVFGL